MFTGGSDRSEKIIVPDAHRAQYIDDVLADPTYNRQLHDEGSGRNAHESDRPVGEIRRSGPWTATAGQRPSKGTIITLTVSCGRRKRQGHLQGDRLSPDKTLDYVQAALAVARYHSARSSRSTADDVEEGKVIAHRPGGGRGAGKGRDADRLYQHRQAEGRERKRCCARSATA